MNVPVDIIPLDADLSRYKLVIAPAIFVMSLEDAKRLEQYVVNGGVLVTTFRTAVKDEYGRIHDSAIPAGLNEFMGVDVEEYHAPTPDEVNQIKGASPELSDRSCNVKSWMDILKPREDARVLARYAGPFAPGSPAIVSRKHGRGTAFYVGAWPADGFMTELMSLICGEVGVEPVMSTPENVEALLRHGANADYLFLTNHNYEACSVPIERKVSRVLLGSKNGVNVELEPFGVAVLELSRK
jgi:beta-galactosidase